MDALAPIALPQRLKERFDLAFKYKKVMLLRAPCGYGKTSTVRELLKGYPAVFLSAGTMEALPALRDEQVVVVDELQKLTDPALQDELCRQLREAGSRHFILLTRGEVPSCLMPFLLAGVMEILETEDLALDRAGVTELTRQQGLNLPASELDALLQDTQGYPVLVSLIIPLIRRDGHYRESVYREGRLRMYSFFDQAVYQPLPPATRRLLMLLSPFDGFDVELARMVSGDSWAGETLAQLRKGSSMFLRDDPESFAFRPIFRDFLLWKLSVEMSGDEETDLFMRAGLYYELKDNLKNALDCYARIGAHNKISELLQKNAVLHVGTGQYLELEKYYFAMPREEILKSPTLIAGMSMLCSLFMDYDRSDEWYAELRRLAGSLKKGDEKYEEAQSRLAYLDIALPQTGTKGLLEVIKTAFHMIARRELTLPGVSVTSTLPSVINGGKDFCLWAKNDNLLYPVVKKPVEGILGRDGVGLMVLGMCESKFEKDEDYQPWLLDLAGQLARIQQEGTPDIEFAAVGLLARVQVLQGNPQAACDALHAFRARMAEQGEERFFGNLDALLCRIDLRLGRMAEAERWMNEKAPADDLRIWVLYRYQYFTKALMFIARGDPGSALLIMNRLVPYIRRCGRIMDELHMHLISAICHFRQKDGRWEAELEKALNTALEYRFVNPVAQYGRAILPLLTGTAWEKDKSFLKRLVAATRGQAAQYPQFLQLESHLSEPLTDAERQVLHLLCQDMSNQEICEILGIKLATVKTHVSHILQKLGVKSRGGAKAAAEKNGLI